MHQLLLGHVFSPQYGGVFQVKLWCYFSHGMNVFVCVYVEFYPTLQFLASGVIAGLIPMSSIRLVAIDWRRSRFVKGIQEKMKGCRVADCG